MRSDMAKVVTERPRRGYKTLHKSNKTHKTLLPHEFNADDHGNTRYPISARRQVSGTKWRDSGNTKEFSDLLNPLKRFLHKQVGRPWDKIFSELSQNLDRRSMAGLHIWGHVKDYVNTNTRLHEDGKVYSYRYLWRYSPLEQADGFYVHPISGLLCYKKEERYRSKYKDPDDGKRFKLDERNSLVMDRGIWYHVLSTPYQHRTYYKNHVLNCNTQNVCQCPYRYETRYNTKKTQLSKKELKFYKLANDPTDDKMRS